MDDTRVHDHDDSEDTPHGCYDGQVFIGHMVEDEDGGEAERIEAVPCKRCAEESA